MMLAPSTRRSDPAREFLEDSIGQRVIVWCDAADVEWSLGVGYVPEGPGAYVGTVECIFDWGVVASGWDFSFATRWDLINWAGPREAFP